MDTKMMSQFSVMDNEELEIVSGGGNLGSDNWGSSNTYLCRFRNYVLFVRL